MPDENLLATLEQSLRQTRATRNRLAARLADLELEAEKLRTELAEMDAIAGQTEAAMLRILSSVINPAPAPPSDAEIESALRRDEAKAAPVATGYNAPPGFAPQPRTPAVPHHIPPVRADIEIKDDRFYDRTIPQATSMILREAGVPLHVNEIYNRLKEGGFQFTGQHPTISIAVSLNRNRRFRKVAPGTFDLMIRDAAQAS
ncbi:MAG: hypothetical protein DMF64_02490 [Acidobacteria bacterium]|nr:MAG: hypothetical protein DMF64_02490 [Acidobacteriota bacterium]